ncbi:MAG: sigma-70 family RNA polymerase sigma factor [Burkholderiaceae bacterium]
MQSNPLQAAERAERRLRALITLALGGDAAAYAEFLRDLTAHLRAFLRKRLTRHLDDVEDITQEVLLAVHTQRHTYRRDEPLTPWVHAIARYKVIDLLRARASREALHEVIDDEMQLFAQSDQEAGEARRDIEKLMKHLPDRHRLPIVHVKLNGLSVAEAARRTGMSESAIKVGIHRGMKTMTAKIQGLR